jgi:hypothetical protein
MDLGQASAGAESQPRGRPDRGQKRVPWVAGGFEVGERKMPAPLSSSPDPLLSGQRRQT